MLVALLKTLKIYEQQQYKKDLSEGQQKKPML
jgi:hypothetical protein